jgi:CHAT domain-containing protein/tetratricopeptide (TPR) repeat protein
MGRLKRLTEGVVMTLALVLAAPSLAQQGEDSNVLNSRIIKLYQDGKYAEAIPLARHALAIDERSFGPNHPNVAVCLNNLAQLLQATNRLAEAEPLMRRALAIDEKSLGPKHPHVAVDLNNLAVLLEEGFGRYDESEKLKRRALAINEKSFGPEHPNVARDLNNLAILLEERFGRYDESEKLKRRALAIDEKSFGSEHPNVARDLNNLAQLLQATNRLAEAEPLMRRALAIDEKSFGSEHPNVAIRLNNLAILLEEGFGRYDESEKLKRRALTIDEKSFGPEHPTVASELNNLAGLLSSTNRLAEAEPLYRRALAIDEKSFGPEHPKVARDLNYLAQMLRATNRLSEVEPLYRRALAIDEKSFGPEHSNVARDLNNLAQLLQVIYRLTEAEPLYRRALAIDEKSFGPEHPTVAVILDNLAQLLQATNQLAEAEPLMRRALAIDEKSFGPEHPNVAIRLNNLAELLQATNQLAEAEPLMRRALAIDEKSFGPEHPNVAIRLNNLAELRAKEGDWTEAAQLYRRAKPIMTSGRSPVATADSYDLAKAAVTANSWNLRAAARAAYRANAGSADARDEGFELAQWALQSAAADALAQMSVRQTKGTGPLAELVRQRQDLISRRQAEDKSLLAAVGTGNTKSTDALRTAMATLDVELDAIDKRLGGSFPDYASFSNPKPLGIAAIQALLEQNEALILLLDVPLLPEEIVVWAVTKTDSRWIHSDLGTTALVARMGALRCGLDETAWSGEGEARCTGLLGLARASAWRQGQPLPFNLAKAHELYKVLFAGTEDLIEGKHLLIVPSGALTQLPFQVLVTEEPDPALTELDAFRHAAWLVRTHALTVLPSVSSLKALRQFAKDSHASRALIGFGNPLLAGQPDIYLDDGPRAVRARANQSCPKPVLQQVASLEGKRRGVPPLTLRGGLADVRQIRLQAPLPETADELCTVAHDLGVGDQDIRLGAQATETEIKRLSDAGELANYRVIHFATHGALAGEVNGDSEPGLLLTPPDKATETDDGYLSASEIAGLKLDADWVILSACNTAAGGANGAQALSGLARSFFYAGARALLVSHWSVYSDATVKLITGAIGTMAADKNVGRAEGMRRSMLALIDKGTPDEAHPAFWAPFVVVGEGGAIPTAAAALVAPVAAQSPAASSIAPAKANSQDFPEPKVGAVITPTAPATGAVPATTTQPAPTEATPPKDKQAFGSKADTKKARTKPKSGDWFTGIFGP